MSAVRPEYPNRTRSEGWTFGTSAAVLAMERGPNDHQPSFGTEHGCTSPYEGMLIGWYRRYRGTMPVRHLAVGVECQSIEFHTSPVDVARDVQRRRALRKLGWDIVEIWWSDLERMDEPLADVRFASARARKLQAAVRRCRWRARRGGLRGSPRGWCGGRRNLRRGGGPRRGARSAAGSRSRRRPRIRSRAVRP